MRISFQKWHGCKNNFIVIFATKNQTYLIPSLQSQAQKLCEKDGSSIGADGILVLEYQESSAFQFAPENLVIINQDGSLAKNCGNGLRCAALACYKRAKDQNKDSHIPDSFELKIDNQAFFCRLLEGQKQEFPLVSLSMGIPKLDQENSWFQEAKNTVECFFKKSNIAPRLEKISCCDLSNRHIVLFVDKIDSKFLGEIGPFLQKNHSWDGINVHLAKELPKTPAHTKIPQHFLSTNSLYFECLHWERGCGFTKACGSGASSIGASLFSEGFLSPEDSVLVKMPGGSVAIKQKSEATPVEMIGSANFIFDGFFEL